MEYRKAECYNYKAVYNEIGRNSDIGKRFQTLDALKKLHIGKNEVISVCSELEKLGNAQCHIDEAMHPYGNPALSEKSEKNREDNQRGEKIKEQDRRPLNGKFGECADVLELVYFRHAYNKNGKYKQ